MDSTLVDVTVDTPDIDCYYVPATQMETDANLPKAANIILLGKLLKETGMFSEETIRKGLEKCIPPKRAHLIDNNLRAIAMGQNA